MISKIIIRVSQCVFYSILCGTLYSCEDNSAKETTIRGQVLTFGTDEVIDHPPVLMQLVQEKVAGCFGCGSYYVVKDSSWTDGDGRFQLSHKLYRDERYYIRAKYETVNINRGYIKPEYSDLEENRIKKVGGRVKQNYFLIARGWVRFSMENSSNSTIDRFAYNFGSGAYEEFFGPFDIERIWDFAGNVEHDLYFGTTSNGVDSIWKDNLFVPAFDTIDYEVHF